MKKLVFFVLCFLVWSCTKKNHQNLNDVIQVSCYDLINEGYKVNQALNQKIKAAKSTLDSIKQKDAAKNKDDQKVEVFLFSNESIDQKIREEFRQAHDKLEGFQKIEAILASEKVVFVEPCKALFSEVAGRCAANPVGSDLFQDCVKKELGPPKEGSPIMNLLGRVSGYSQFKTKLDHL